MTTDMRLRRSARSAPRLLAAIVVGVLALVGFNAPAGAGGWAVTTLDEVPTPVAGTPVRVGFTILQHGVTPVALTEGVGIRITAADGAVSFFPAAGEGARGHYVASVTFPSEGNYTWSARQGMFADHELGAITVSPSPGGAVSDTSDSGDSTPWLRYTLVGATLGLALIAVVDIVARRRRPVTPA